MLGRRRNQNCLVLAQIAFKFDSFSPCFFQLCAIVVSRDLFTLPDAVVFFPSLQDACPTMAVQDSFRV